MSLFIIGVQNKQLLEGQGFSRKYISLHFQHFNLIFINFLTIVGLKKLLMCTYFEVVDVFIKSLMFCTDVKMLIIMHWLPVSQSNIKDCMNVVLKRLVRHLFYIIQAKRRWIGYLYYQDEAESHSNKAWLGHDILINSFTDFTYLLQKIEEKRRYWPERQNKNSKSMKCLVKIIIFFAKFIGKI